MHESHDKGGAGDFIARARRLAPRIEAAAPRIEAARELTQDVVAALHDAELYRLLLPRSCGGAELDPAVFAQVIEEIARADASTAWCIGQAAGCAMSAAYLKPEIARAIFGDRNAVVAWGPQYRPGRAVAVEGGVRVSGNWSFASGSRHATTLGAYCRIYEPDGTLRLDAKGNPVERTFFLPKAQATMKDVWQVVGLCGTGSDSYTIEDVFVAGDYSMDRRNTAERRETGPLYCFTSVSLHGVAFAAVALGIARGMLDAFIRLASEKTPAASKNLLRENAVIQSQVALAEARLRSSRRFLLHVLEENCREAAKTGTLSLDQRITQRMAASFASHEAREVTELAYYHAGATAIFESNPFERRIRDAHAVSQQVQAHFALFEVVGQHLLGLPPSATNLL